MSEKNEKRDLRRVLEDSFYMHVGAIATVAEHLQEKGEEYIEKGREAAKRGQELNKELKHKAQDISDRRKDVLSLLKDMAEEDKEKLKEALLNGEKETKAKKKDK